VAKIKLGLANKLTLGNLDASRDWGHARDYVQAMWLMLNQDQPDDYVIATEKTHTIRTFLELAFGHVGLDYQDYVVVDPQLYRPAEVNLLLGDCSKARKKLSWTPSASLPLLVKEMVDSDLALYGGAVRRGAEIYQGPHQGIKLDRVDISPRTTGGLQHNVGRVE
jgi:GDPmannose 4,6-dehydratase